MRRWYPAVTAALALTTLAAYVPVPRATADDKSKAPSDKEETQFKPAEQYLRQFKMRSAGADGKDIDLSARPLLSYGDAARTDKNGTLWAWGKAGRPVAFVELFHHDTDRRWIYAVSAG